MARRGDLVCFAYERRIVHALIVQWGGNPDSLALLMDQSGQTYRRFVDACIASTEPLPDGSVVLTQQEAAPIRQAIMDLVESKRGKRRIEQSASDAHLTPDVRDGRGVPALTDVPLVLAQGRTSWPTEHVLWRLTMLPGYERELERIRARYPAMWQVYVEHLHRGQRLVDVAHRLGITPATARKRFERGRKRIADALREVD